MTENWLRTHCARFDHGGCGLRVLIRDGKPVKVLPDFEDPFSRGHCCAKGLASLERIDHPRRLTHPLKRKGRRGEGEWLKISWDEALDTLAAQFGDLKARYGPESLSFLQGAPKGVEFFLAMRLANLLGCPHVGSSQHVCHMPREQMAMVTCGFFPVADLDSPTRCVLLWGSHPMRTNEEGVLGIHLRDCLKQNPALIVIDPVKHDLARRAHLHLQIRPGSDGLLAMGFLHVLMEEKLYDEAFVKEWTTGFDELKQAVASCTPQEVARGTWVEPGKIVEAARLYATSKPALIQWGNAIEHTVHSAQCCRSLVLLMALTGNLEVPGGNVRASAPPLKRLAEFLRLDAFPDRSRKLLNRRHNLIPRLLTTPNWVLFHSILQEDSSGEPGTAIRGMYVQGANPMVSGPQAQRVKSALMALEFLAVADQVMTPTAALADLVLPVATNFEFNDMGHYGLPHGYVLARPKLVEPRGECRSDLDIVNEWGKRMGFQDHFWSHPDAILDEILAPSGITYQEFAQRGVLRGPRKFFTYREKGFSTPSGKVELASSLLQKWGYDWVPSCGSGNDFEVSEAFPLLLTSAKPRHFFHSAYRHLDGLRKKHPQPCVRMHPSKARELGLERGEAVRIVSAVGEMVQELSLTDQVHPSVVVADYGWWFPESSIKELFHWDRANINCLTSAREPYDPIMGTNQLRAIPCRVEKVRDVPSE